MQHSRASLAKKAAPRTVPKLSCLSCRAPVQSPMLPPLPLIASSPRAVQRHHFHFKFRAPLKTASFLAWKYPIGRDARDSQKLGPPSCLDFDRDVKDRYFEYVPFILVLAFFCVLRLEKAKESQPALQLTDFQQILWCLEHPPTCQPCHVSSSQPWPSSSPADTALLPLLPCPFSCGSHCKPWKKM